MSSALIDFLNKEFEKPRYEGWEIYDPQMGDSFVLECPHGHVIEQDGRCPEGCVSPLIRLGLI